MASFFCPGWKGDYRVGENSRWVFCCGVDIFSDTKRGGRKDRWGTTIRGLAPPSPSLSLFLSHAHIQLAPCVTSWASPAKPSIGTFLRWASSNPGRGAPEIEIGRLARTPVDTTASTLCLDSPKRSVSRRCSHRKNPGFGLRDSGDLHTTRRLPASTRIFLRYNCSSRTRNSEGGSTRI